jgi:hypothetical protein
MLCDLRLQRMGLWLRCKSIVAEGNHGHIVQVKTSRPAMRLSLHLLGAFENQLSSVNLIFIVVGVIVTVHRDCYLK